MSHIFILVVVGIKKQHMHNDFFSSYFSRVLSSFIQPRIKMRLQETKQKLIGNGHIGNKMRSWLAFFHKVSVGPLLGMRVWSPVAKR